MGTYNGDKYEKYETPEGITIHNIKHDLRPSFQRDNLGKRETERDAKKILLCGKILTTFNELSPARGKLDFAMTL